MDCIINADKLQTLYDSIIAVQRYFYDNVQEKIFRIGNLKGDWNSSMSSDATDEKDRLNKYDVVRYPVDGVKQYFLVYGDEIEAGKAPLGNSKYLQMSLKGDKGDQGYSPIKGVDYFDGYTPIKGLDYTDGASGLGMSPRGAWANNVDYQQYDVVSHNGYLWYCLEDNFRVEPIEGSNIWVRFNISMQTAFGTEIPSNLEHGGIWMHLQDDGRVVLKTKDENGNFAAMYPETYAEYIKDTNGQTLQKWLYQRYFDRDDVKITFEDNDPVFKLTATLLTTGIVVAEHTITDSVNMNGKKVHHFTAYDDETGKYVMYRYKKTETLHSNYLIDIIPEVV